jgi:hypothetical protein
MCAPESVRLALRRLTHGGPGDYLDADITRRFHEATKEAIRRAFAFFREDQGT